MANRKEMIGILNNVFEQLRIISEHLDPLSPDTSTFIDKERDFINLFKDEMEKDFDSGLEALWRLGSDELNHFYNKVKEFVALLFELNGDKYPTGTIGALLAKMNYTPDIEGDSKVTDAINRLAWTAIGETAFGKRVIYLLRDMNKNGFIRVDSELDGFNNLAHVATDYYTGKTAIFVSNNLTDYLLSTTLFHEAVHILLGEENKVARSSLNSEWWGFLFEYLVAKDFMRQPIKTTKANLEESKYGLSEDYPDGFPWKNESDELLKSMRALYPEYDFYEDFELIDDATWLEIIGTW